MLSGLPFGLILMPSSLLALLDDIATILDDVAILSKAAAKKTAGVLGDDLALNAKQVSDVQPERELPVVWAVAKGSMKNKLILVPAALALSVWLPWLVMPLLMLGGLFLCYEGVEKLAHKWLHSKEERKAHHEALIDEMVNHPEANLAELEKDKIRGAVRTDFILSAEIIVISLGTIAHAPFGTRVAVLSCIAVLMTVGVYGLVAGIVKIDDVGQHLAMRVNRGLAMIGRGLLWFAPRLMKALAIGGTAAMFLVCGGILVHGIESLHHLVQDAEHGAGAIPVAGVVIGPLAGMVLNALAGMVAGFLVVAAMEAGKRLRGRKS